MRYLSMFSGIEAATVAWHPLGWEPAAFCEIEPFPSAVLKHHYPNVPNLGDVTKADFSGIGPIDLAVFGSPCQSFSIAGKRLGLDDPRGNLALYALGVVERLRPRWFLFENVPGLLSSGGGRDFGAFLGTVGDIGYQCAWRTFDAQYFGVPQRRRRVFVVGCAGDWRSAAAVLFERHSLQGNTPPRRETRQGVTQCLTRGTGQRYDPETVTLIGGWDYENNAHGANEPTGPLLKGSPTGGGRPLPAIAFAHQQGGSVDLHHATDVGLTLQKSQTQAICFDTTQITSTANYSNPRPGDPCHPLAAGAHAPTVAFGLDGDVGHCIRSGASKADKPTSTTYVGANSLVRRLTPRECERLQGFPDDYTLIPYRNKLAADGPRYKALGNSMAVPVMRWIGQRIEAVRALEIIDRAA